MIPEMPQAERLSGQVGKEATGLQCLLARGKDLSHILPRPPDVSWPRGPLPRTSDHHPMARAFDKQPLRSTIYEQLFIFLILKTTITGF